MLHIKQILICFLFGCVTFIFQGQERPPINIFLPEHYGGDSQNWSVSQSSDKYIYVANNKGLLEFNGSAWNLYKSPNQTIVRAVSALDSIVYTGSYREFGYWLRNKVGFLEYTSLSDKLNVSFFEDEEFWNIKPYDDWVLFQSLNRIHVYNKNTNSYNTITSKTNISRIFEAGNIFYYQDIEDGLYKIERGNGFLVSNHEVITNNIIVNIYDYDGKLLVLTQDEGFYVLDNNEAIKWNIPANNVIENVSVFSSIKLHDNSYLLGTISDGIINISNQGVVNYQINKEKGLGNNTVLSLYEDIDNNIWLGLDNGINCLNTVSPYRFYYDTNGKLGSVHASIIHNNNLYLGTNQGLFFKELNKGDEFQFIDGTQGQVWCLEEIRNELFCGHNTGTFVIEGNKAKQISKVQGTWKIRSIDENTIIQGNYKGLNILQRVNGVWGFRNKVEGFNISSRYFELADNNEIFVNHEYKGVFRLKTDEQLHNVISFYKDSLVQKGKYSSLVKHNNNILYTNSKGVFKLDKVNRNFKKDTLLSGLISANDFISAKLVSEPGTNKLWSFSSNRLSYLAIGELSGVKKIHHVPFSLSYINGLAGYENISHINDEQFLIGTPSGYAILDLNKLAENEHQIRINNIKVIDHSKEDIATFVKLSTDKEFSNSENSVQFSYSSPVFSAVQAPLYQYKLEGYYNSWSDWTNKGDVVFENLPYGNYLFKVRAKIANRVTDNIAEYSFTIQRPWYLSNKALILYAVGLWVFSVFMHNLYKGYYKRQRERLLQKSARELELKELENKQQLMRFRNEKLREDIDNKNRELGVSTMNLIKKNEFLNAIKKELQDLEKDKDLKKVIRIIDRNLNNNDDWNLFQEAFNNADKDFLKKIKELHPSLTSNDLRLCAYLRLNLSSKEIAPLLNISPRSVEVKRYRLRKKMELPHESNLSDYILEV
ncbi:triple tyrosine motif-containing protein [Hyunsoonleella aestuarii]|uniref:HTH luxR-type domain-containing protein n=1 Tax=Hyunsoonleella aestuarii TaxID=912802 RepID=A0ABP8E9A7_9FLAO|nr:triple tyrosine motif-containing protein [Hyunsoonleella aestuarii]